MESAILGIARFFFMGVMRFQSNKQLRNNYLKIELMYSALFSMGTYVFCIVFNGDFMKIGLLYDDDRSTRIQTCIENMHYERQE